MVLVPCMLGCSSITYFDALLPTPEAQYRAYGDSITYGYSLPDPRTQSYPSLVSGFEHVTFANNAIPGDEACDVTTRQIFPNDDHPDFSTHPTYTVLIGTNDVDRNDAVDYEPIFALCHRALVSWLAIPEEHKTLAGGSGASTHGPGTLLTTNKWNAWTTGGKGSSVGFRITLSRSGSIYAWPLIDDDSDASYQYSLDGAALGTEQVQTSPGLRTKNGTKVSLGFLEIDQVPAGTHVVTFVQTSSGADGVSLVGIGSPAAASSGQNPAVLVGTVPLQNHESRPGKCTPTEPLCLSYVKVIEDDAAMFSAAGLDVRVFDTRKYMHGTRAEMWDNVHPNALGQQELARSVEAAW